LNALTDKTITDLQQLRRELKRVREQGCAVDDEETEPGGRCVAAPIFGRQGSLIGAISIVGPANRVNPETIPALSEMVRSAARGISRALGHRGNRSQ
jgi:DNA-binding IclR family transcriptional regulator